MSWHQAQVGHLRAARRRFGAVALLVVVVGGCDTAPEGAVVPTTSDVAAPPATSSSEASERDAVVAAYDEYWVRTHEVPHQPPSTWREAMAEVAVDPQLKTVLQGMRFAREAGITSYGSVTSRVSEVDVNGNTATVVDCQDASNSGQAALKTGEKSTVGVPRNPVRARLKLDPADVRWKVAKITFPRGDC